MADTKTKYRFPDLNQLCRNGRGRGETKDGALPTLTTSSGRIWSQATCVKVSDLCESIWNPVIHGSYWNLIVLEIYVHLEHSRTLLML